MNGNTSKILANLKTLFTQKSKLKESDSNRNRRKRLGDLKPLKKKKLN